MYRLIGIASLDRVLDVGCGPGELTAELDAACRGIAVGCDVDEHMIATARQRHPQMAFHISKPKKLPFDDDEFDLACAHLALMWADDPLALLVEMRRVTKPDKWIAALAEPDYGTGFYYPGEQVMPAAAEELRRQGADPCMGRKLPELFARAGLRGVERGTIQSVWSADSLREEARTECEMVGELLGERFPGGRDGFSGWRAEFEKAAAEGRANVFMPLYFAVGRV